MTCVKSASFLKNRVMQIRRMESQGPTQSHHPKARSIRPPFHHHPTPSTPNPSPSKLRKPHSMIKELIFELHSMIKELIFFFFKEITSRVKCCNQKELLCHCRIFKHSTHIQTKYNCKSTYNRPLALASPCKTTTCALIIKEFYIYIKI
jgi:hypothetical protein